MKFSADSHASRKLRRSAELTPVLLSPPKSSTGSSITPTGRLPARLLVLWQGKATTSDTGGARRWWALIVVSSAQMLIVIDACSVSVALPSAQAALGISDLDRLWITSSATLTWGALLLLGGRIADYAGRKLTLLIGLFGFAGASIIAGSASGELSLIIGRALQGAAAGLITPAALAILTGLFQHSRERARAFGIYGGMAATGSVIGLLLGGVLTQVASWRWCLFADVPIAFAVAVGVFMILSESKAQHHGTYDVMGAITGTLGIVLLAYGITRIGGHGGMAGSGSGWALILAATALLVAFWTIERRSAQPLLPPAIVLNRRRAGALLTTFVVCLGVLPVLMLTLYLQRVLGYSAMGTGLALVPISLGTVFSSIVAGELIPRLGGTAVTVAGLVTLMFGLLVLAQLSVTSSYVGHVLPGQLLVSLGLGLAFVPLSSIALHEVAADDSGAGSAAYLATQQVAGALGAAILNTVVTSTTAKWVSTLGPSSSHKQIIEASVHGYAAAFNLGAAMTLISGVIAFVMLRRRSPARTRA